MTRRFFRRWVRFSLVLVYSVVSAGAAVRMTGSGMGCPDWPKCFGHYVPPTDEEQLLWEPEKSFRKGQMIICDSALFSAVRDLRTGTDYNPANWRRYTRQDYAAFNAYHTWMEYVNRLIGALAGLAVLALALFSLFVPKDLKSALWISWLAVWLMGLQAWLGAWVVYSALQAARVSLHMLMAWVIIALLLLLLVRCSPAKPAAPDKRVRRIAFVAWLILLIQALLGTQTRQFVDAVSAVLPFDPSKWLAQPAPFFYMHRSFSILVLLAYAYLFYKVRMRFKIRDNRIALVFGLLFVEAAVGASMAYLSFPFGMQALHLVLSSLVFGLGFYIWIKPPQGLTRQP
ncbi:MAG: COX15/CtaA family protein [Flavobacteriales bacterium]